MITTTKLYINGIDAYATWGLQLDGDGGLDALVAFRPMKEPVTNKNVTAEGAVVVCGTGLMDERSVAVPVHITAKSYSEFMAKKNAFEAYMKTGKLSVEVRYEWKVKARNTTNTTEEVIFASDMYYTGCNQYTQFVAPKKKVFVNGWSDVANSGDGIAKFILNLYEPNTPVIVPTVYHEYEIWGNALLNERPNGDLISVYIQINAEVVDSVVEHNDDFDLYINMSEIDNMTTILFENSGHGFVFLVDIEGTDPIPAGTVLILDSYNNPHTFSADDDYSFGEEI